jgi:3',5'-cyclic AMP phosphodiesterase CpdA
MDGPKYTLFQFSDAHIIPEGKLLYGKVDTLENLKFALATAAASEVPPSALVFSGDLTEAGEESAYYRLRSAVGEIAEKLDVPTVFAAGNHDSRSLIRTVLMGQEASSDPIDHVTWLGGLRVITIDTSSPGRIDGDLTAAQLEWLRAELATPAPDGSVLMMHHPPFPVRVTLRPFVLNHPERLAEVVRGSDLRMIFCGHAHQSAGGMVGGVPVWVSGATSYRIDALSSGLVGFPGSVMSRIDVYEDAVVATQVPITNYEPLYEVSREELARGAASTYKATD